MLDLAIVPRHPLHELHRIFKRLELKWFSNFCLCKRLTSWYVRCDKFPRRQRGKGRSDFFWRQFRDGNMRRWKMNRGRRYSPEAECFQLTQQKAEVCLPSFVAQFETLKCN